MKKNYNMKNIFFIFSALCTLVSCSIIKHPSENFIASNNNSTLDYFKESNWAFKSGRDHYEALLPKNLSEELNEDSLKINVFYIHPTTLFYSNRWNSDTSDFSNDKVIKLCLENQASVFAGICNIYAPYYRQMHIYGYIDTLNGYLALDLAYNDVLEAFKYFITHINNGNKFIIASHSQGTNHAERLITNYIHPNIVIRENLILTYLIGMPITDKFDAIPICQDSSQLNCFVSWRTFYESSYPKNWKIAFRHGYNIKSVNPITWKTDSLPNIVQQHKGILLTDKRLRFRKSLSVYNHQGMVWVRNPTNLILRSYLGTNYHIADYNLFWFNIRENLKLRLSRLKEN